jgi:hypothetical protein
MYVLKGTGHALGVVRREEMCEEESVLEGSVKPGKMGRGNGGAGRRRREGGPREGRRTVKRTTGQCVYK